MTHSAHRLLAHSGRILEVWRERVRVSSNAARGLQPPILINTFPAFLRQLAEALNEEHPRLLATDGSSLASEHGGERVRLTDYRPDDLLREMQLLRDAVLDVLVATGPLEDRERSVIMRSFDDAICQALTAFLLVETAFREQFVATLTHDLRGPLTAAKAAAGLIVRKPQSPDVARWANRVLESMDRADAMTRDLLDVSRVRAGGKLKLEVAEHDVLEIVRDVVERLETLHGDRFVIADTAEGVRSYCSREAISRALENLLNNAIKYGGKDTPVIIRIRERLGRLLLHVDNHGSYIPVDQREQLFQAFRRSTHAESGAQAGWGLGLAVVRAVAEAHGGSVGVDSAPEWGTSFVIDIPLDARPIVASGARLTPFGEQANE
jgi:signal transduction histidine kinase